MMQQVATAKSELAAFAIGAETSGQQGSATQEQFGLLLKDQQNSLNKHDKSVSAVNDTATKNSAPSIDKSTKNDAVSFKKEKTNSELSSEDTVVNQAKDKLDADEIKDTVAIDDPSIKAPPKIEGHDDVKVKSSAKGEHDVEPIDSNIDFSKSVNMATISLEGEVDTELENIELQQWVSLVDNLQGLQQEQTDLVVDAKDKATKLPEGEVLFSDSLLNSSDNNVDANLAILRISTLDADETNSTVISQDIAEKIFTQLEQAPNKGEFSQIVSEILETLSDEAPVDIAVVNTDNINSGIDSLPIAKAVTLGELEIPDLTNDANKSLLIELLQDNEQAKVDELSITAELDSGEQLVSTTEQSIVTAVTQQVEEGSIEDEIVSDEFTQLLIDPIVENELTDEAIDTAPEVATLINSIEPSNKNKSSEVKALLDLLDTKLEKVLESISSRVIDPKQVSEATLSEQNQLAAQRTVSTLVADITPVSDQASKEFVAALKTGLQEFKSQLAQGREPGIDLKGLVAEAASKVSEQSVVNKAALNSDITVNSVSQVIDFASTLSQALEHNQNQSYNNYARDVAQIQGEQSKQIQLSQLETKYDKAINITKPEGHQQLAEKVRWMVNTKNLVADIRLDPAELGSVHVKVAVSGESATVNFVVQSHHARDAVDSATPRLREMLADKGIELGQSSVRQESDGQQQGQGEFAGNGGSAEHGIEEIEVSENMLSQQKVVNGALGGIDYFV